MDIHKIIRFKENEMKRLKEFLTEVLDRPIKVPFTIKEKGNSTSYHFKVDGRKRFVKFTIFPNFDKGEGEIASRGFGSGDGNIKKTNDYKQAYLLTNEDESIEMYGVVMYITLDYLKRHPHLDALGAVPEKGGRVNSKTGVDQSKRRENQLIDYNNEMKAYEQGITTVKPKKPTGGIGRELLLKRHFKELGKKIGWEYFEDGHKVGIKQR